MYMDADELTDIAEYYMVNQREEEALDCIHMARELHPDAVDPQIFLARQHLFHNRLEKAKRIANQITDQDDREVLFLRQEILIKEDRYDDAQLFMEEQLMEMEEDRDHFIYDTAGVFADYNLWQEAYDWTKRLLEEYPDYERANSLLCEALINIGRSEEALPMLEKEVDKQPFDTQSWYLLSQAYMSEGHTDEALEALDYLLAIDEHHPDGQLFRANCLMMLEKHAEAHKQFEHYLERHPNDPSALFSDATALISMMQYQEAVTIIERALQMARKQGADLYPFRIVYSNALSRLGRTDEALVQLNLAEQEETSIFAMQDDGDEPAPWDNHYDYPRLRAFIYLDAHEYKKAMEIINQIIEEKPDDLQRLIAIAIYLIDHEFFTQARNILDIVMEKGMGQYADECMPYLAFCAYMEDDKNVMYDYVMSAVNLNPIRTGILFSSVLPDVKVQDLPKYIQSLY